MRQLEKGTRQLRTGRRSCSRGIYLVTSCTENRQAIFSDSRYARIAIEAFTAEKLLKGTVLLSWVLMPDHAHWLFQLSATDSLSTLVGKMKSASARHIHRAGYQGQVWQSTFHDKQLVDEYSLETAFTYIANNPVAEGLVQKEESYPYFWCR